MSEEKRDYYQKEEPKHFSEPCDTCVFRELPINDKECPCKKCIHFA